MNVETLLVLLKTNYKIDVEKILKIKFVIINNVVIFHRQFCLLNKINLNEMIKEFFVHSKNINYITGEKELPHQTFKCDSNEIDKAFYFIFPKYFFLKFIKENFFDKNSFEKKKMNSC